MPRVTILLITALSVAWAQVNPRPVVGILSLPNDAYSPSHGYSQFPASYVKFLESSGNRVVPIPFDLSSSALNGLLSQLNGALFTGGAAAFYSGGKLTQYGQTAQRIFNESVNAHANGEVWPLWGTCLGFELISVLAAENGGAVLTPNWDSENYTATVAWAPAAATSRVWSDPAVRAAFTQSPAIAFNAHTQGVSPANFAAAPALSSRFDILGTSVDRNGKEFVATIEGKDGLPIYATQWHPEKALFEWPLDAFELIPHSLAAVTNNYVAAAFFGAQTRLNSRVFTADSQLIYNFSPLHGISDSFEQIYFFPQSPP